MPGDSTRARFRRKKPQSNSASAHGAFVPQRHIPAEQLSANAALQPTQVSASMPHVVNDEALHVDPWQHPFGHDVELQTQAPPEHTCPAAHAGPVPH